MWGMTHTFLKQQMAFHLILVAWHPCEKNSTTMPEESEQYVLKSSADSSMKHLQMNRGERSQQIGDVVDNSKWTHADESLCMPSRSVLISVTTDMSSTGGLLVTWCFRQEAACWACPEHLKCCASIAHCHEQHTQSWVTNVLSVTMCSMITKVKHFTQCKFCSFHDAST